MRAAIEQGIKLQALLREMELSALKLALEISGNNQSEAARRLGLRRTTFLQKLRKHGLRNLAPQAPVNTGGE